MRRTTLRFLGATRNVTGSRFLIESDGTRVLVDCGLYQEREFASRNWERFPVPPDTIDAVLLTHAHLDHSGYLPKLVREGFRGRILCTAATADIARIILEDSARIQEEDAAFKKRRHEREGRRGPHPEVPLYTVQDAERVPRLFSETRYRERVRIGRHMSATLFDAGHILGSASVEVRIGDGDGARSVLFSGDLGQTDRPLLRHPKEHMQADYVVMESTYGDRVHDGGGSADVQLEQAINEAVQAGGNVVIPSFAVERAQEVLHLLRELMDSRRIPRLMVFLDSPMATDVTEVYERHPDLLDRELADMLRQGESPFRFPGLTMVRSVEQSKAINQIRGTTIIIAGSGMANGGRIKHHLVNNIGNPSSTVLFVGYQAHGTLGRQILDGNNPVRILGQARDVRARVRRIDAFSAHADRNGLMAWLKAFEAPPRSTFVVHGEEDASKAFADAAHAETGWPVRAPEYEEAVELI